MGILDQDRTEKRQERCEHPERAITKNFGLERVVCLACGKVEMHHLGRAATGGKYLLGRR